MAKYIDIEKLEKGGWSLIRYERLKYGELKVEHQELAEVPVADVAEVRHGRWEELMEHRGAGGILGGKDICVGYACSECGEQSDIMTYYCPNCGASMVNEDE